MGKKETVYVQNGHKFIVEGKIQVGQTIKVTVEPADGYEFVAWADGNTDNPRIITIDECGANFVCRFNNVNDCDKERIYSRLGNIICTPFSDYDESCIKCDEIDTMLSDLLGDCSAPPKPVVHHTVTLKVTTQECGVQSVNIDYIEGNCLKFNYLCQQAYNLCSEPKYYTKSFTDNDGNEYTDDICNITADITLVTNLELYRTVSVMNGDNVIFSQKYKVGDEFTITDDMVGALPDTPTKWFVYNENDEIIGEYEADATGKIAQPMEIKDTTPTPIVFRAKYATTLLATPMYFDNVGASVATISSAMTTLQYSKDTIIWKDFGGSQKLNPNQSIYFKAKSDTTNFVAKPFSSDVDVKLHGNIMSLLYNNFSDKTVISKQSCFKGLFGGMTYLKDASDLLLPATTLSDSCYQEMFKGCTALEDTPVLDVKTLTSKCYESMFEGCAALTETTVFKASTMKDGCYRNMFKDCTSLTYIHNFPNALILASNCYEGMFKGCTALDTIPTVKGNMAPYCCTSMFEGCTSLEGVTKLRPVSLAVGCYSSMFKGCTALTEAPELPAYNLAQDCYAYMFEGCTSLETAPDLIAYDLSQGCYKHMFSGCSSLNYIKALFINTLAGATDGWVHGVSATGDFYKSIDTYIAEGDDGVPTGWTRHEESRYTSMSITADDVVYNVETTTVHYTLYYIDYDGLLKTVTGDDTSENFGTNYTSFDRPVTINYSRYGLTATTTITQTGIGVTTQVPMYFENISGGDCEIFVSSPKLLYSTDGTVWDEFGTQRTIGIGEKFYFKGRDNNGDAAGFYFSSTKQVNVGGNIMSLIYNDFENKTTLTSNETFSDLFGNMVNLVDASNLLLPATTLTNRCYNSMFYNCKSLTNAPALPATTLGERCYENMFEGCKSLTQAPALPATTLTNSCYMGMFYDCTALTQAPALPATTLSDYCYWSMFRGCTALTQAPALPATTLGLGCYNDMFEGCTALVNAPALPATILTKQCYMSMFYSCTALTNAPGLPATTLAKECYSSMFEGCTALTNAPGLPATTLVEDCYKYMFKNCGNLNYIKIGADETNSRYSFQWTDNVSRTGDFYVPATSTWQPTPTYHTVPSGWNLHHGDN